MTNDSLTNPVIADDRGIGHPGRNYYCADTRCWNCGNNIHRHIRKGCSLEDATTNCDKCECRVNFKTGKP